MRLRANLRIQTNKNNIASYSYVGQVLHVSNHVRVIRVQEVWCSEEVKRG